MHLWRFVASGGHLVAVRSELQRSEEIWCFQPAMKGQKDPAFLEHPPLMETCVAMAKHKSMDSLPEWSKGVDSSSTGANLVGSNPTAVTFAQAEQSQGHVLDHASGNKVGA